MKHFTILLITLFISFSNFSQSHKDLLKKEVAIYLQHLENENFDGILDYMYPKVFETFPREQLKAGMQQMFNSSEMKIEFISNDIKDVSESIKEGDITYAALFYNSKMRMTFLTEQNQPEEDKKIFIDFMKSTMDTQFGADNITADVKTASLVISMDSEMFAILDPKYKEWKLLGNDDSMKAIIDNIIPESIRTQLLKDKE